MEHNKLVYIASPYSGDVERNVAFAKAACRYAMNQGVNNHKDQVFPHSTSLHSLRNQRMTQS